MMLINTSMLVVPNAMASGGTIAIVGKSKNSSKNGNGLSPIHGLTMSRASALRFSLNVMELIGKLVVSVNIG